MNKRQSRLLLVCGLIFVASQLGLTASSTAFGDLITVTTDTTWRGIGPVGNQEGTPITSVGLAWEAANPGWNTSLTFDDTDAAGWKSCVHNRELPYIWVDGSNWNGSTPSYYRKVFALTGTPTSGLLGFGVDDDAIIYINGQLVISDTDGVSTDMTGIDVTSLLAQGKNLIAVKAHDSWGANESLKVNLDIEGAELLSVPVVSTSPATYVTKSSATLNGSVSDDGGEACQYSFRYRDEKVDYLYTFWTGSVTSGQSFSEPISGLNPNTTYYFNAQARNSAGESAWGNEQSFVARPGETPEASFKYKSHNPKTGQNVQFDASSSEPGDPDGTIITYLWFFGDDGTSTVASHPFCNHTFKKAGEWTVTLTVTDDDYLEASTTSTIKVRPNEFMITFDDGPYSVSTRYILDQLSNIKKADGTLVKAGFFLIGEDKSRSSWKDDIWQCNYWGLCPDPGVISNPDVVRDIDAADHLIGIHTQHHPDLSVLKPTDVVWEILDCYNAILDASVTPMKVFRSPGLKDPTPLPGILQKDKWRIIRAELTNDWLPESLPDPLPSGSEEDVIGKCRDILQKSTGESPVILIFHDYRGRPGHELNFYNIIVNELVEKDGFVLVDFEY